MGTLKGPTLLAEDSLVFKDKMIYSLVTKVKSLIYFLPSSDAYLPPECAKSLRVLTMEKYNWVN